MYAIGYLKSNAGNFYLIHFLIRKTNLAWQTFFFKTRGTQNKVYFAKYAKRTVSVEYLRDITKEKDNNDKTRKSVV